MARKAKMPKTERIPKNPDGYERFPVQYQTDTSIIRMHRSDRVDQYLRDLFGACKIRDNHQHRTTEHDVYYTTAKNSDGGVWSYQTESNITIPAKFYVHEDAKDKVHEFYLPIPARRMSANRIIVPGMVNATSQQAINFVEHDGKPVGEPLYKGPLGQKGWNDLTVLQRRYTNPRQLGLPVFPYNTPQRPTVSGTYVLRHVEEMSLEPLTVPTFFPQGTSKDDLYYKYGLPSVRYHDLGYETEIGIGARLLKPVEPA